MSADIPTLRLQTPADILASMPFVVGYYPSESVVVLGLAGRQLTFAARDDLPATGAPPGTIAEQVDYLLEVLLVQDCTAAMVIGVGPRDRVDPILPDLIEAYENAGLHVVEALRADDGRYWSYLCDSAECCPPEGLPFDPADSRVAAEWTYAGVVARRDRSEYEAQLAPVVGPDRDAIRDATEAAHRRLHSLLLTAPDERAAAAALTAAGAEIVDAAVAHHYAGERLTDDEVAWLSVLLVDPPVENLALRRIPDSIEDLELHQALWTDVVRRCEPDLIVAPATLLGYAAWRAGNGGLARMALERAKAEDPGDPMVNGMLNMLSRGVPPSTWDDIVEPFRRRGAPRPRKRSSSRRAGSRRA